MPAEMPKNIDADLAEMSENLEASKNSWFEKLFGIVKKHSPN